MEQKKLIDRMMNLIKDNVAMSSKPYYQIDHDHCWNQGKEPACGLPKDTHEICCLCVIPKWKKITNQTLN